MHIGEIIVGHSVSFIGTLRNLYQTNTVTQHSQQLFNIAIIGILEDNKC